MLARKVTIYKPKNLDRLQVRMVIPKEIVKKMRLSEKNNQINITYDPLTKEMKVKRKK